MAARLALGACLVAVTSAKILYKEEFGEGWDARWVTGAGGDKTLGKWEHTAGDYYGGEEAEAKGIMTSEDYRHYFLSTKFDEITNADTDLVIQYQLKFTKTPDCGGSYIKLLTNDDPSKFDNDSPSACVNPYRHLTPPRLPAPISFIFPPPTRPRARKSHGLTRAPDILRSIMFGPDQCGGTKRVHAIITYKGENKLKTSDVSLTIYDELTHVYSFVIKKDQTYEVFVDLESKASGNMEDDWEILKAKKINDPELSKPEDWVEDTMMDDPEDVKPEGWDDIPEKIVDPEAEKPEDWDDEDDGEWEAPTISNPEYKGAFTPKRIDNPEYKGAWVHAQIDNPEYEADPSFHVVKANGLGFELWQVKGGSLFDNIIITDSWDDAKKYAEDTWKVSSEAEKKMKEDADAKKAEADKAAADAAKDEEEDEEEDDEKEEL
jgi:calreticulin